MELIKQDEILIKDLQEFANDLDVNESGIYTQTLDFIRRLQYDCSSAHTASAEWKEKYEVERKENIRQKAEIERLMEENKIVLNRSTMWKRLHTEVCEENAELQKQVNELTDKNTDLRLNAIDLMNEISEHKNDYARLNEAYVNLNNLHQQAVKDTVEKFAEMLKEELENRSAVVGYDLEDLKFKGEIIQECIDEVTKRIKESQNELHSRDN